MAIVTYLQLHIQHCRVEAQVNDIVVERKNEKDIVTTCFPVHQFLIGGENTISLKVQPYNSTGFDPDSYVHMRVAKFEEGEMLEFDKGELLSEISFDLSTFSNKTDKTYFSQSKSFMLVSARKWVWQTAGVMTLNKTVTDALNKLMLQIYKDFKKKEPSAIVSLSSYHMKELAECYPVDVLTQTQQMKEYIRGEEGEQKRNLVPLKVENLAYRLAGNGRLIECVGKDGLPLIRTHTKNRELPYADESYMELPMHVGFVDNDFYILR